MTKVLMSQQKPDGFKLEELLQDMIDDLAIKTANMDGLEETRSVILARQNNQLIADKLKECIRLQTMTMASFDSISPDTFALDGKTRLDKIKEKVKEIDWTRKSIVGNVDAKEVLDRAIRHRVIPAAEMDPGVVYFIGTRFLTAFPTLLIPMASAPRHKLNDILLEYVMRGIEANDALGIAAIFRIPPSTKETITVGDTIRVGEDSVRIVVRHIILDEFSDERLVLAELAR